MRRKTSRWSLAMVFVLGTHGVGCSSVSDPDSIETLEEADIQSLTYYTITLESITPVAVPYSPEPNKFHFHLEATGFDATSGIVPAPSLWSDPFRSADVEVDDVHAGNTYVTKLSLASVPVNPSPKQFVRFVAFGEDDVSDLALYLDPREHDLPTYASTHATYMKQVHDYLRAGYFSPLNQPPFALDIAPSLIPGAVNPGAGKVERTCSGPFFYPSFSFSGEELYRYTENGNTYVYEGDFEYPDGWDPDPPGTPDGHGGFQGDGCGPRPETRYRLVIQREDRLPPPRVCVLRELVPADTTDHAAWIGTWGEKSRVTDSRVSAEIHPQADGWLGTSTHELVRVARTTSVASALQGTIPFLRGVVDYTTDKYPSRFQGPPTPRTHFGYHDILASSGAVTLEAYIARCTNGDTLRRMRYMRRDSGGTIITDVMMSPSTPTPK